MHLNWIWSSLLRTADYFVRRAFQFWTVGMLIALANASDYPAPYAFEFFAGCPGSGWSDGPVRSARFSNPVSVVVDAAGNVYVADGGNAVIRRIGIDGVVTTIAGRVGETGVVDGPGPVARFRYPVGLAIDEAGNLYVADSGNHCIRKISPEGLVRTLAGQPDSYGATDGAASVARFMSPMALAVDRTGTVYVADTGNNTIRRVTKAGEVTTLAGRAGVIGSVDGDGTAARFRAPHAIVVDDAGTLFVADMDNFTIRKITNSGSVTTIAGKAGAFGWADGKGDSAQFASPAGLALDHAGNLYVADSGAAILRKVTAEGVVTTLAGKAFDSGAVDGTGEEARFSSPYGLSLDAAGNLYVAEASGVIRKIAQGGVVTTYAAQRGASGSADGEGVSARFENPGRLAVDGAGNLYVADRTNQTIRKITSAGIVTTLAGLAGKSGQEDGTGAAARFYEPHGLAVDSAGNLYVADTGNSTVRKIATDGVVTTLAGSPGEVGSDDGIGPAARFYSPVALTVDDAGSVYVADAVDKTIRKITTAGEVTTLAGLAGADGFIDGPAADARFSKPVDVALDGAGGLYVLDGSCVRRISRAGMVTTVAGAGEAQGSADGAAAQARFSRPAALAVDAQGNIFVADSGNYSIRKISTDGNVTTLAGTSDDRGFRDGVGLGVRFFAIAGLAVAQTGELYVADEINQVIQRGRLAPPLLTSAQTLVANRGLLFSSAPTFSGHPASFTATGLPAGLTIDATTGVISGVATGAGLFTVEILAAGPGGIGSSILALTVNDPPTIGALPNQTIAEDTSTALLSFAVADAESPAAELTVMASSSNPVLVPDSAIVLGGTGGRRTVRISPAGNRTGVATITLTVSDGQAKTATRFILTVTPVNDAPTIGAIAAQFVTENTTGPAWAFTVADVDTATNRLTVKAASSNETLIPVSGIVLGGSAGNRTVRVTPAKNKRGKATITLTVSDGSLSVTRNFAVTVNGRPTIAPIPDQVTQEDTTLTLPLTVSDPETSVSQLTVTAVAATPKIYSSWRSTSVGRAADGRPVLTLRPDDDVSGTDKITVTVSDGHATASTSFKVTVKPVNDVPWISSVYGQIVARNGRKTVPIYIGDTETPSGQLVLSAKSSNESLLTSSSLVFGGTGAYRTLVLEPVKKQMGHATVTVTVSDGASSVPTSFGVEVEAAPTIQPIADQVTNEDTALSIPIVLADDDTDVAALRVQVDSSNLVLLPRDGAKLSGTGAKRTLTLKPARDQYGVVRVTLSIDDNKLATSTSFKLTVKAVNDAPTLSNLADLAIRENGRGQVAFTIADKESPAEKLVLTVDSSSPGLIPKSGLVLGGNGAKRTLKITPTPGKIGKATLTVGVSDGTDTTRKSFIVVVDRPPTIAAIDDITIKEDTTATIALTIGDAETSIAALTLTAKTSDETIVPAGNITFSGRGANRTMKIKPAADQTGSVKITVSVNDGYVTTDRSFTLKIVPVNDAPRISGLKDVTMSAGRRLDLMFQVVDVDTPLAELTAKVTSSVPMRIMLGLGAVNSYLVLYAPTDYSGKITVTVTVSDGLVFAAKSFTVTVGSASKSSVETTAKPAIVRDLTDQIVKAGEPVSFTVTTSSAGDVTYRWFKDEAPLVDAKQATLTIASSALTDAGGYRVTVANTLGAVTSRTAELTVVEAQATAKRVSADTLVVTQTLAIAGEADGVGLSVLLPAGWSYRGGSGAAAATAPQPGDTDLLEWTWTEAPVQPLTFAYTVKAPVNAALPAALDLLLQVRQPDATANLRFTAPLK